jgi:HAE1 family hydrophobic/amphiphilic exporter-1
MTCTAHAPASLRRLADGLYQRILHKALDAPMIVVIIALSPQRRAFGLLRTIPQELTPPEDRSIALMRVSAPQGVSLDYTREKMREIERLVEPLRESGEVQNTFSIAGLGSSANSGFMVLTLAPWEERSRGQAEIVADMNRYVRQVPGVRAFAIQPNSLGIRGAGNGLQFAFVGNSYAELGEAAAKMERLLEDDRASPRCGSPTRRRSLSFPCASTASAPPISASTSTASPRRCRRCSTAARSRRCSSTTAPSRETGLHDDADQRPDRP